MHFEECLHMPLIREKNICLYSAMANEELLMPYFFRHRLENVDQTIYLLLKENY